MKRIFLFLSLIILSAGCGRKSLPKPPETTAPAAVELFQATGKLVGIELKWQAPTKDATGDDLVDLEDFVIEKNIYDKTRSPDFDKIGVVPIVTPENSADNVKNEKKEKVIEFSYIDSKNLIPGKQYDYMVRARNADRVLGKAAYLLRVTFLGETSTVERIGIKQRKKED